MLVQYNKETGKNEFPIGSALLNILSPTRRKANYENMQSDQSRLQDFFSNAMVPEIFGSKSNKEKEESFKRLQNEMKTQKGKNLASTWYGQVKESNYDISDKKNTYGKGLEEFNKEVEKSGSIAQSAAGGISGAFEKIKASGIAAKAGAFAANVGIGLIASGLMQLASWAASKGIDAIKKAATYDKDKIEAADKTRSTYQDKLSDTKTNISTLKGSKTEFESLSKGVDEYGNNISLDTSSYERFLSIRKEILDTTPSLISGYDAEGNAIAKTSGLMDKAIESQEKKQESIQKKYASDETWDKLVEGNIENVKKASGTWVDKFWGNDMDTLSTQLRNSLQGDKTSQLTTAFNKAVKDVLKLPEGQTFDLYNQADMNKFIGSYSEILNKMEDNLPEGSDFSKEISNIAEKAKKYKTSFDEVQKVADQYNTDIATTMPGSISDYNKLGGRSQSFITGLASNTYSLDTATYENLQDKDWVKKQRKNTIDAAKKFANDDKAQKYLNDFIKKYNKTGNKSAEKWLTDATDAYDKFADRAVKDGADITQINKALEDSFNVGFKIDKNGNFEELLKDGKNVDEMITGIKEKLGDNSDTEDFIDSLDFTEMSQAFDIVTSKTEKWTGSLDQLKERLKLINQTKSQSTWSDYLQAKETADSGDTYLAMREAFNAQKKERDKGLIGTDDFKTLTSVMSASGKTDAATFDKTWAKTTKYFTEDNTGLVKFLDDLSVKSKKANSDFGTLKKTAEGSYSGKITNTATAAKSMGMGIEAFEAVLNRLKDYGGEIKFDSIADNWNEAEKSVDKLTGKWEQMKEGAGKTALGEEIEEYRQKILKLKNAEEDIPSDLKKSLEFSIKIADYTGDLKNLKEQYSINQKSMTTEEKNKNLSQQVVDSNNILHNMTGGKEFGKGGLTKGVKVTAEAKADIKDAQKEIDKLSEEFANAKGKKKVKIGVELTNKQEDLINKINKLLPKDKQIPINVVDNATSKIKEIDAQKIKNKKFIAWCKDHATQVMQAIKAYQNSLHDKTITITTKQRNIIESITKNITQNGQPRASGRKNGKGSSIGITRIAPGGHVSAHGTANAHGSFVPRSNAYSQGTIDDLTDWYDDEIDDLEGFDAFAHGTIKKLGCRALAMGTTKISDLSEINPVVQTEKNKYLQEKTDKLKSSVGDAHANGGDWGLKQDERALTGELGDELVV